jgi:hypothetical protein
MTTLRQLAWTFAAALAALFAISRLASAEFIYDIEGVFAPALNNPVSASFVGELNFPEDDVSNLTGFVELTNEPDVPREFVASMALNLPGSLFQPWDTRLYSGIWNEQAFTMTLVDFDQTAGTNLLASQLEGGGGWDGWVISFADYPVGSVDAMTTQVNEPAGYALLAIGGVIILGLIRSTKRTESGSSL